MLIFTLLPIMVLWTKFFSRLKKNLRVIIIVSLITLVFQFIADPFAESWQSWYFNPDKSLGIWIINFPIENIIFTVLVSIAISSAIVALIEEK